LSTSDRSNLVMNFLRVSYRFNSRIAVATGVCLVLATFAQHCPAQLELVDIKSIAPTIVIDLRYATPNNVTGRPLYPQGTKALILPSVAQQVAGAQKFLRNYNCGLKIWDAYRPKEAQALLWRIAHKGDYVTNPEGGIGSLHSWGVAVDATLVDIWGRELNMPTRFDEFTPQATMYYHGTDPAVQAHLRLLQVAMAANNFYGLRIEWWHFVTADWKKFVPDELGNKVNPRQDVDGAKTRSAAQEKANPKS
jgi:zinc D-Ala-D-Ala dipeptidase